jgi:hypothetical protein
MVEHLVKLDVDPPPEAEVLLILDAHPHDPIPRPSSFSPVPFISPMLIPLVKVLFAPSQPHT